MNDKQSSGAEGIELEATLYKPDGDGPFPLVIYNHGSTGRGAVPLDFTENPTGLGQFLLARNIALLVPMRRGRGKSGGRYLEGVECSLDASRRQICYAAESLDAVYDFLRTQPWVSRDRIILIGTSRGGMLSVMYAADNRGAAVGVVNVVGGWLSDVCVASLGFDVNAVLFEEAGRKATVPHLFLYATQDPYYTATRVEDYADAFRKAGGNVDFTLYEMGPNESGHDLFYVYWRRWAGVFDTFLRETRMLAP